MKSVIKMDKFGDCQRCRDYGMLYKTVWDDPYSSRDGWGWICGECVKKLEKYHKIYQTSYENRDTVDNGN